MNNVNIERRNRQIANKTQFQAHEVATRTLSTMFIFLWFETFVTNSDIWKIWSVWSSLSRFFSETVSKRIIIGQIVKTIQEWVTRHCAILCFVLKMLFVSKLIAKCITLSWTNYIGECITVLNPICPKQSNKFDKI